ncbi:hypothetical protein I4F81_000328 [Pyropia yezoensis]|uniref:Uncharacterized protein n=1 Tax=Pyropia yezoensis TaxID=2788 RepID=A0ACC3BJB7_PYRYE|nr:hypothetical protein I4F81_000328 [Neopyropia yezoensis]
MPRPPLPPAHIFHLHSSCVFTNLATEELLLHAGPPRSLLLYRNAPAVVLGRTQNPWAESRSLPPGAGLARRRSGGGTVYHDRGNVNYSFLTSRATHTRLGGAHLVANALSAAYALPESVAVGCRGDLSVAGAKVSGAAYRLTASRALHHGTLLVAADLAALQDAIVPGEGVAAGGTASVRAPAVGNLSDWDAAAAPPGAVEGVVADAPVGGWAAVLADEVAALRGWAWVVGETPPFVVTIDGAAGAGGEASGEGVAEAARGALTVRVAKGALVQAVEGVAGGVPAAVGTIYGSSAFVAALATVGLSPGRGVADLLAGDGGVGMRRRGGGLVDVARVKGLPPLEW